ncbi:MAG TPA: peptide chain release factor 1 [Clostridiales bacterium]|nr:MAG: Peptide chain release factor 1 [Firmicutes bacterium ADurb.Bin262]HOU10449.1 peptide chain release factor 1 [Clostridiales bacterium]HQK72363.1 peptide chain release factor 1 [Clostridiales bacterium]
MLEKLKKVEERYETVNAMLYSPGVAADREQYTALLKELKQLAPVVEKYRSLLGAQKEYKEAEELLAGKDLDKDFRDMVLEELELTKQRIETITAELKVLLLPRDPNDDKNVIVEIRSGAGGEEASLFAGVLFRMYCMYAERMKWKTEVLNASETELGGMKEISFMVQGDGAYSRFKFESGVHRVQRVPETESQGRIHTSTVTVAVLPEADEVDIDIKPTDLQIDTYRSSGAGGQHVNTTDSAIRITHLPTGTVVECQDERSQYKNKDKAMKILRSRILEAERLKQSEAIAGERKSQVGTGDRSERIRTYNYPQGRVSDHRIGLTIYRLEAVLNGDLDEIIDALITADTAEKLNNDQA